MTCRAGCGMSPRETDIVRPPLKHRVSRPVRSGLIIPMDVSHGFLGSYDDRQQNMLKLTAPMFSVK
jgi:hypothetical protein